MLTDYADPVLLCNDLGQIRDLARDIGSLPDVDSSGRASMSIKESARIAQSNNFMGLICRSSLLVRFFLSSSLFQKARNANKAIRTSFPHSSKQSKNKDSCLWPTHQTTQGNQHGPRRKPSRRQIPWELRSGRIVCRMGLMA